MPKKKKIGYFQRRKPKAFLLQNYIGVDHALVAVQKRVAVMKNPTKKEVFQLIKDYRARVHEYAEAIHPGASKALWTEE